MSHRDKTEPPEGAAAIAARADELFREARGTKELLEAVEAYWHVRLWLKPDPDVSWRASQVIVRQAALSPLPRGGEKWLAVALHDLPEARLVDLLRRPACVEDLERAVCARLSKKTGRELTGAWDAAAWARDNGLGGLLEVPVRLVGRQPLLTGR
jgi:hypothetical protein